MSMPGRAPTRPPVTYKTPVNMRLARASLPHRALAAQNAALARHGGKARHKAAIWHNERVGDSNSLGMAAGAVTAGSGAVCISALNA